ncbi:PREDICTED: LOC109947133, partial [Prunus dulcis]
CQLSSNPRRAGGTTSGILHFKSSPRCRDSLSENGEAHFFACSFREKTKALLPSTPDNCHDRISFEIDPPQPRRFSTTHEMGYRTQSIRPPLPAEDCYKSPSFSRFCCRVYSDSRRRED